MRRFFTNTVRSGYNGNSPNKLNTGFASCMRRLVKLAEAEAIPQTFLEQILLSLKGFGLVRPRKGNPFGFLPPHLRHSRS